MLATLPDTRKSTLRLAIAFLLGSAFCVGSSSISSVSALAPGSFRELVKEYEKAAAKPLVERLPILQEIGKCEEPAAGAYLANLLTQGGKTNSALHETVIWILADRGDAAAIEATITHAFSSLPETSWRSVEQAWAGKLKPDGVTWLTEKGFKAIPKLKPRAQKIVLGLIAGTRDPRAGVVGMRLLGNRKIRAPVQALLVDLVRTYKLDETAKKVNKLFRVDDPDLQIAVLRALRDFNAEEYSRTFRDALESRHWQVRALAVDIFGGTHDPEVVFDLTPLLGDPYPEVQVAVVYALRSIGGRDVVVPLIDAMLNAPGRVRDDIADTLLWLTGQDLGPDHLAWSAWWKTNGAAAVVKGISREEFDRLRKESEDSTTGTYYGLRVISKYVTFIVDVSGSMEEPYLADAAADDKGEKKGRGGTTVEPGSGRNKKKKNKVERRKIEVAREELTRAIKGLKNGVEFNMISFDSVFNAWQPELIEMNDEVRDLAVGFVANLQPGGTTNIFDTLIRAFQDEEVNTIYFLSDGAPTAGSVTDMEEILRQVREANDIRKVKIHTIGFHLDPNAEQLMRRLAEENFGTFVKR